MFFRGAETHSRSVLKAMSWRTLGTLDTFAISWFMTGRVEIAGSIAGMEIITKVAWYYLHERVWAVVPWGRRLGLTSLSYCFAASAVPVGLALAFAALAGAGLGASVERAAPHGSVLPCSGMLLSDRL